MIRTILVSMLAVSVAGLAAGRRHVEGNPESAVRVIAFESLACGDCAVYRRMLDEKLLPKYGAKVAFEHRDFPLEKQPWSRPAAIVARAIEDTAPELAVKFRREILHDRRQVTSLEEWVAAWARKNGLDPAKLQGKEYAELVERDHQDGVARGVSKTPTVFVNGAPFIETFTFEEMAKAIEDALAAQ
jgi:protein-disulfide isomerase